MWKIKDPDTPVINWNKWEDGKYYRNDPKNPKKEFQFECIGCWHALKRLTVIFKYIDNSAIIIR